MKAMLSKEVGGPETLVLEEMDDARHRARKARSASESMPLA